MFEQCQYVQCIEHRFDEQEKMKQQETIFLVAETSGMGITSDVDAIQSSGTSSTYSINRTVAGAGDDDNCGLRHDGDDDDDDDDANDYADRGGDEQLQTTSNQTNIRRATSSAKWPTKVFAADCVQKLINYCEQTTSSNFHFNYIAARERQRTHCHEDYLVTHLNTLITFSFMSCTSTSDQLRLSGLSLLKQIIIKFAHIQEDLDLPDHVILEQYQAQVGAALRPAFSQDTSSHVTAQACDVCSTWIASGVAHDLNDLRRVHQLLVSSLQKFTSIQQHRHDTSMVYSENALTIENLAVLRAWADVYNVATQMQNNEQNSPNSNLLVLVQPELNVLIHHWLAALTDYAFLILPHEFGGSTGSDEASHGGNFYSAESNLDLTRTIYKANWPSIMQATSQWLAEHHYELETLAANQKVIGYRQRDVLMTKFLNGTSNTKIRTFPDRKDDIFMMLFGNVVRWATHRISHC
jgi:HEAT repeat-containing protein 5